LVFASSKNKSGRKAHPHYVTGAIFMNLVWAAGFKVKNEDFRSNIC
jgi:hypothetical protein